MYIHRNFIHPGGVSPTKHAAHYPGNKADHTIADHAKQKIKTVKKEVKKEFTKASDKLGEKIDKTTKAVAKGAKKAWDQAGYAYRAYTATPQGRGQKQTVSDILSVASVPANIVAEATEGISGKGDGEFDFTDAMPDLSGDRGSFNFRNMNGKPTKSVSAVAEIENPYLAFAVDLATDPSAYFGAGVVRNAAGKAIRKSTKTLVKKADLPKSTKTEITKSIDSGATGPKPKGAVDGGGSKNIINGNEYYKGATHRGTIKDIKQFDNTIADATHTVSRQGKATDNALAEMDFKVAKDLKPEHVKKVGTQSGRDIFEVSYPDGTTQKFWQSSGGGNKTVMYKGEEVTSKGFFGTVAGHMDNKIPKNQAVKRADDQFDRLNWDENTDPKIIKEHAQMIDALMNNDGYFIKSSGWQGYGSNTYEQTGAALKEMFEKGLIK